MNNAVLAVFQMARIKSDEFVSKRHEYIDTDEEIDRFVHDRADLSDDELRMECFNFLVTRLYRHLDESRRQTHSRRGRHEREDDLTLIARRISDELIQSFANYFMYCRASLDDYPREVAADLAYKNAVGSYLVDLCFYNDEDRSAICINMVEYITAIYEDSGIIATGPVADWIAQIVKWMKEHNGRFREWITDHPTLHIATMMV